MGKFFYRVGLLAVLLFISALCLLSAEAEANVFIERAIPKPESTIEEAPEELRIQFSQKILAPLSRINIRDYTGQTVTLEHVGSNNELIVLLPTLEPGIYYVDWRVLGRDGAITEGSYRFAINVELTMDATSSLLLEGATLQDRGVDGGSVHLLERLIHLVNLVLLVTLTGWIIFQRFLWNVEGNAFIEVAQQRITRLGKIFFWSAGLLFFVAGFAQLGIRLSLLFDGGELWQALKLMLTSTSMGWITLARPLLVLVLYLLFFSRKSRAFWLVLTMLTLVVTFSLESQGFYLNTIISHSIHLAAFIVWLAGLAGFSVYTLFIKRKEYSSHVYFINRLQAFYILGLVLLFFLIISGLLLSSVYISEWSDLVNSDYGHTLLWKIILLLPLVALVLWHRFVWIPNLSEGEQGNSKHEGFSSLLLGIRLELGLVILIFFISGFLSTLIPPGDPHLGHQHDDLFVHLDVYDAKDTDKTTLLAYVLWERKRLAGATVTFEVWDKEHENLLTNAEEYCRVNNMSIDFFRQSLIEQGFIYEIIASELESIIYSGQIDLTPGVWQVGVNVKHNELDIEEYNKFILNIK